MDSDELVVDDGLVIVTVSVATTRDSVRVTVSVDVDEVDSCAATKEMGAMKMASAARA